VSHLPGLPADAARVLAECLSCGQVRERTSADECARCAYVGWAPAQQLTEPERKLVRDRPLERRRLRSVA
jgi:hypothetical protein